MYVGSKDSLNISKMHGKLINIIHYKNIVVA